jgi:hypothetical protein
MVYDNQTVLQEFQKFLLDRKLVPENLVPFHAHWVSRFLRFARGRDISLDEYQEEAVIVRIGNIHLLIGTTSG